MNSTGRGVLAVLTPRERLLIREALDHYRAVYVLSLAEDEIANNLLRRIPAPDPMDLT